jgi:hypothetical protein
MDEPRKLSLGSISVIFNKICDSLETNGFVIASERKKDGTLKTAQTVQVYLKDEDYLRIHRPTYITKIQPTFAAVQYEGSNDFSKKPPHTVNWRFYRNNIPEYLKNQLEHLDEGFRRDTNDGPRLNPKATSIAFKFSHNDKQSNLFIERLADRLAAFLNGNSVE